MRASPFTASCSVAGCPQPVHYRGRCEKHAAVADQARGLESDRRHLPLYRSARWQRLRRQLLREHPVCRCERCVTHGHVRLATVVHHRQPHHGGEALFFDLENLQTMAKECHDVITGRGKPHRKVRRDSEFFYRLAVPRASRQLGIRGGHDQ